MLNADPLTLDLRDEFADVYSHIAGRVRSFDPDDHNGPGAPGPVTRIDLGFGFDRGGWLALVFDTRPDAQSDDAWCEFRAANAIPRPHWAVAARAAAVRPVRLSFPYGEERIVGPGGTGELAVAIGTTLKRALLVARADGVFRSLPKASNCVLGVEEWEGVYGWPVPEAGDLPVTVP